VEILANGAEAQIFLAAIQGMSVDVVHDLASGDRIWEGQIQDVVMQGTFYAFAAIRGRADGINIITSSFMRLPSPLGESGIIFIIDNGEITIG